SEERHQTLVAASVYLDDAYLRRPRQDPGSGESDSICGDDGPPRGRIRHDRRRANRGAARADGEERDREGYRCEITAGPGQGMQHQCFHRAERYGSFAVQSKTWITSRKTSISRSTGMLRLLVRELYGWCRG